MAGKLISLNGRVYDSIAFCGGGGKGAYHIGVWKALMEMDVLRGVKAVSGTSIGGLNAVLFALGDYERAKSIWENISEKDVFSVSGDPAKLFAGAGLLMIDPVICALYLNSSGVFSRKRLEAILDTLELSRLADSPVKVYVNVCSVKTGGLESFELNGLSAGEQKDLLLATTSLPFIYGMQDVNGELYWDGGMAMLKDGNIPITPLYDNGCRNILISSLDHNFSFGADQHPIKGLNARKRYPDAHITALKPLHDLGSFVSGTLNFSPDAIRERMVMGYSDTIKILMREDVYYLSTDYSRINLQIRNQMERMFASGSDIERFIKETKLGIVNIELPTMGGHVWYTDIVDIDGWRLQQHNVWPLHSHYRILDPDDVRRAWVLDPEEILRALIYYEDTEKFHGGTGAGQEDEAAWDLAGINADESGDRQE